MSTPPSPPPPPPPPPPASRGPDQAALHKVTVGGMFVDRRNHQTLIISDWRAFLSQQQPDDTCVSCGDDVVVLDGDVHHWPVKPTPEALRAYAEALSPAPDFFFTSHGSGLKGLYLGPRARNRASLAALSLPKAFKAEVAHHFRHPASKSTKHGTTAGQVHANPNAGSDAISLQTTGTLRSAEVDKVLVALEMSRHHRYDHTRCLIAGDEPSDAGDCVTPLDSGIFCHRCAGKGLHYPGVRKAGYVPYTALAEGSSSVVNRLAGHLVHWEQARHELKTEYPNLSESVLEDIYRIALEQRHEPNDPRIPMVFNSHLRVLYTTSGWVDSQNFTGTKLDNDLVDSLPAVLYTKQSDEEGGGLDVAVDRVRRSEFKSRTPSGYIPIQAFRGICLSPIPTAVPVEVPPKLRYPVEILADPMPREEAMAAILAAFPGMDQRYLLACICAMICAEVGGGQPPAVTATGPSGSGKGETINIAASFLGDQAVKVQLHDDPEAFMRQIGSSTAAGFRALVFDEMGKIKGLQHKMANLLQIAARITYRPLYQTGTVTIPFRSAYFFPCVYFPDFLCASPEFVRRTRGVHLASRTKNWRATCGGDAADWRNRSASNARIGNSILTHAYRLCVDSHYIFDGAPDCVADRLELGSISDGAEGIDPIHLINLYRYARGDNGERHFFENDPSFAKGWLDLDAPQAKSLISVFAAGDDQQGNGWKHAVKNNLQAACWNDVLGFAEPPVAIQIKIHGSHWGMRFRSSRPCKKGDEVLNEALPLIPDASPSPAAPPDAPRPPDCVVAEILAASGFPTPQNEPPPNSADMLVQMLKNNGLLGGRP